MVDSVTMLMGIGQMWYLVLAREDLMSQVEGRALTNKMIGVVCRFLIEDVICQYGCVGVIVVDQGDLDIIFPTVADRGENVAGCGLSSFGFPV